MKKIPPETNSYTYEDATQFIDVAINQNREELDQLRAEHKVKVARIAKELGLDKVPETHEEVMAMLELKRKMDKQYFDQYFAQLELLKANNAAEKQQLNELAKLLEKVDENGVSYAFWPKPKKRTYLIKLLQTNKFTGLTKEHLQEELANCINAKEMTWGDYALYQLIKFLSKKRRSK